VVSLGFYDFFGRAVLDAVKIQINMEMGNN